MTDLEQKAAQATEMVRASDATGAYRLQHTELVDCDEITDSGEFPKFGDWAEVVIMNQNGEDRDEAYLEMPANLAKCLVELGVGEGDEFVIESVTKNGDEEWTFDTSKPANAENFMG